MACQVCWRYDGDLGMKGYLTRSILPPRQVCREQAPSSPSARYPILPKEVPYPTKRGTLAYQVGTLASFCLACSSSAASVFMSPCSSCRPWEHHMRRQYQTGHSCIYRTPRSTICYVST
eukprot:3531064-Rhodomonas_salina.3